MQFWKFDSGAFKKVGHKEATTYGGFKCACVNHAPLTYRTIATGGLDGALAIWDPEDFAAGPVWTVRDAHKGTIYSIDGCAGSNPAVFGVPQLVTGGADGVVRVWDPRQKEPVAELKPPEGAAGRQDTAVREMRRAQEAAAEEAGAKIEAPDGEIPVVPPEVWAVALLAPSVTQRFVAAGYDTGLVVLWDVTAEKVLWSGDVGRGVTALAFDRPDVPPSKLFIGTLEGRITVVNIAGKPHETLGYGARAVFKDTVTLWFVSPLPQNRNVLVTPGSGGGLTLWRYECPEKSEDPEKDSAVVGELVRVTSSPLGQQPLSGFAWSQEFEGLFATVGYDQAVNFGVITRLSSL